MSDDVKALIAPSEESLPSGDDRKDLTKLYQSVWQQWQSLDGPERTGFPNFREHFVDAILAAGFRRSPVPPVSGEPSEAQVEAAGRVIYDEWGQWDDPALEQFRDLARAALRAAGVTTPTEEWEYGVKSGYDGYVFEFPTREQAEVYAKGVSTRTRPNGTVEEFARQLVCRRKAGPWGPVPAPTEGGEG